MTEISPLGRKAIEQARIGDFESALATARQAIALQPDDQGLRFFAAMLHSRRSEYDEAAGQLRTALRIAPGDPMIRAELIQVLAGAGRLDEAQTLLAEPGLPAEAGRRLEALLAARRGRHERASALYRTIVRDDARDFESWGNLGVSLLATGDHQGALTALDQALRIRPGHSQFREKWVDAHIAAGSGETALKQVYGEGPDDPAMLVTAARLEDLLGRAQGAVEALQRALAIDQANEAALAALADLQERGNSIDELDQTLKRLQQAAPSSGRLPLLRARSAYRRGDYESALKLAASAPEAVDPAARAHLIGIANDRLDNAAAAFAAFETMNRIDSLATSDAGAKAERYLGTLRNQLETLTPAWVAQWTAAAPPDREPAFLVGFPRSGTTLLDTLLMNDPSVAVSEENPMLSAVSKRVGDYSAISRLDAGDIDRLRQYYFDQAETHVPGSAGRLLLDKFPLALGAGALIHRLFPTAPILFLARHPCDVVLSCFMTRFQPTDTGSAFLSLDGTARLYDAMMSLWMKSKALLPLRVHEVQYEALVNDPRGQLKRVADFLGIGWTEQLLDNRAAAEGRGFIKTPSYSQVAEPIYRRAVERWRKYEEQLAAVIPILQPWIERLGYR